MLSVPSLLVRLLALLDDGEADVERLSALVARDPALSANLLRFGRGLDGEGRGGPVQMRALVEALGPRALRTLVLAAATDLLFQPPSRGAWQQARQVWPIALSAARLARDLAARSAYHDPEQAYYAGLLHRLGQLATLERRTHGQAPVLPPSAGEPAPAPVPEQSDFGPGHALLAAGLADRWGLDGVIGDALRFLLEEPAALRNAHPLVRILALSARLADPASRGAATQLADRWFGLQPPALEEMLESAASAAAEPGIEFDGDAEAAATGPVAELTAGIARTSLWDALGAELQASADTPALLRVIRRQMDLLFEFRQVVAFLTDGECLQGRPLADQDPDLARLPLTLADSDSRLASALRRREITDSAAIGRDQAADVLDRQLCRLLGGEAWLAIPMLEGRSAPGLLVAAVPARRLEPLRRHADLLSSYGAQAGRAMLALARREEARQRARLEDRARYQFQARQIVHEINSPLAIVANYLHVLGAKLEAKHPAQENLAVIREEVERVSRMLLRLPEAYSEADSEPGWIPVNETISQLVTVFEGSLFQAKSIRAHLQLARSLPEIKGDLDKFKQVLVNLLINAVDAADSGGRIQLTTHPTVNVDGRTYVEVLVSDDGPGIAEDRIEGLFRPQPEDPRTRGSGLGLAIAAKLMRELGGTIGFRPQPAGVSFQLLLPRVTRDGS